MAARSLNGGHQMQRLAIGIDLGGTQVRAALVDEGGTIVARVEDRTEAMAGPERVLSQIRGLVDRLFSSTDPLSVAAVGISTPVRPIRPPGSRRIFRPFRALPTFR